MIIQSMVPYPELWSETRKEMAEARGDRFRCEMCDESFDLEDELMVHKKNHAPAEQSPVTR